jgi:transcriptional regulator with XRE-family HTH domain
VDDVERAILAAWQRIKPQLLADPAELARRLARARNSRSLQKCPRPWCLALRAGDTRIEHLTTPYDHDLTGLAQNTAAERAGEVPHKVWLDARIIKDLCAPVGIEPGLTVSELAAKLGVRPQGLIVTRINRLFDVRHFPQPGGRGGKPQPYLYTEKPLDPSFRGFALPDPVWSWTPTFLTNRLPEQFEQAIQRVPVFHRLGPSYRDKTGLHPEHPDLDPPPKRPSYRLPPPQPDLLAWYKWKDGQFLGYDWRNPRARIGYERHEQAKARARAARAAKGGRHRPSRATGSLVFRGWRWICPRCGRHVRVLFLPVARISLLPPLPTGNGQLPTDNSTVFACSRCHRLWGSSRASPVFWNAVVSFLSGGLLYGRDVPRPSWFKPARKRPYTPRPGARPALRRLHVQERLLQGWSYTRIAVEMGIKRQTVLLYAHKIYAQHRVHSLWELARHLGVNLKRPPTKRDQIKSRLSLGQSPSRIARDLGISLHHVRSEITYFRRKGLLPLPVPVH